MRLIDADALIEKLDAEPEGGYYSPHDVISLLMIQPVVEERKKGKWIDETFKPWGLVHHPYKCDQCGEHSEADSDFCPNCGAYMRGDDHEND